MAIQSLQVTNPTANLAKVPFHGQTLITLKQDEIEHVAMRPITEGIGLSWERQYRKLISQQEKFNCCLMATVAEDGKQREMLCIPLRKLNGWLFTINPAKVKPEIKERVIQYQEECFEVLYSYWHTNRALAPVPSPVPPSLPAPEPPALPSFPKTVTVTLARQKELEAVIKQMAYTEGGALIENLLYKEVLSKFKIYDLNSLPECLFPDVVMFVRNYRVKNFIRGMERPEIPRLPLPEVVVRSKTYSYPLTALYPGGEKNRAYQKSKLQIPFPEVLGRHPKASQVIKLLDELTANGSDVSGARREVDEVYGALRWFYDQSMNLKRKLEHVEGFGDKASA